MPTSYKDFTATSALNEDQYVNKLYDKRQESQQGLLKQNQQAQAGILDQNAQNTQAKTNEYQDRTQVEAQKAAQKPTYPAQRLSYGANAQASLSRGNQLQRDTTALNAQQSQAEAEIERQRQDLAAKYSAAIQQATAENDMQRAQQLYDAAKAEEKKLQDLRKEAATFMQGKGDKSILESIVAGNPVQRDTTSETLPEVLRNEEAINKIYDASYQAKQAQKQAEYQKALSELNAQQAAQQRQTDSALNAAYVDALQKSRNYAETQGAYGMGSGTLAGAQLSRELGLQKDLTDLRTLQLSKGAALDQKAYDAGASYREALQKENAENELKRAQALFGAASDEQDQLLDTQKWLGELYAKKGDYSILGKLYGLTPEQIAKLNQKSGGNGVKGKPLTGIPALDYGVAGGGSSGGSSSTGGSSWGGTFVPSKFPSQPGGPFDPFK